MFIMIVISASSVALAAEDPLRGDLSKKNEYLNYMDFIFTGVFTVEMILKVIEGVLKSRLSHDSFFLKSQTHSVID